MVREWITEYKEELMEMWNTQKFKQLPSLNANYGLGKA